jgi:putative peptide zinc metalloprotease protein
VTCTSNLIFMLALAGRYPATSAEVLLLVIAITHLEMLEQLLPFVRFDGCFILSDLAGVPDLFARMVPCCAASCPRAPGTRGLAACAATRGSW